VTEHVDETGRPCTRHAPSNEALLAWAAVGARVSGFHHDTASKLQSLMMALDEATDLLGDSRPDVQRSLETAVAALRDIHALLTENRALAKAPQRKPTMLSELLKRAANRHGVKLVGQHSSVSVVVAPPSSVHALGLLLDHGKVSEPSADAIRVLSLTGRRLQEVLRLAWRPGTDGARGWVDLDRGVLVLTDTKTGLPEEVPLSASAQRLFERRVHSRPPSPWVFASPRRPDRPLAGLQRAWERA